MTRKNIDAAREARLWLGQIIVPTLTTVGTLMTIPEVREGVAAKARDAKQYIKNKLKKD